MVVEMHEVNMVNDNEINANLRDLMQLQTSNLPSTNPKWICFTGDKNISNPTKNQQFSVFEGDNR